MVFALLAQNHIPFLVAIAQIRRSVKHVLHTWATGWDRMWRAEALG